MSSDLSTQADSSPAEAERRARIVDGAMAAFIRYGYRRAAMADIAAAAGLSRPSLYLVFPNKAAVFRALAETLLADAAAAAQAAWPESLPVADGLAAAILAKDLPVHRLLASTSHAAEILAETESLTADLHLQSSQRFEALVAARLADAGATDPDGLARLISHAASGLKHAGLDEATYTADVARLAQLIAAGLAAQGD